jgi:hypothetical protein
MAMKGQRALERPSGIGLPTVRRHQELMAHAGRLAYISFISPI